MKSVLYAVFTVIFVAVGYGFGRGAVDRVINAVVELTPAGGRETAWRKCQSVLPPDEVLAACNAVIQSDGDSDRAAAAHFYGALAVSDRDPLGAIVAYTRALEIDPEMQGALHNRADLYFFFGEADAGLADAERILAATPGDIQARLMRAMFLYQREQREDARAEFTAMLGAGAELEPQDRANILAWRSAINRAEGNAAAARADLESALAVDPNALTLMGALCWQQGTFGAAQLGVELCDLLIAAFPNDFRSYVGRGLAYLRLENNNAAFADFDYVVRQTPIVPERTAERILVDAGLSTDHSHALYGRGVALSRNGQRDRANADFVKAVQINSAVAELFASMGIRPAA